mgnify:CR=1 FL=1
MVFQELNKEPTQNDSVIKDLDAQIETLESRINQPDTENTPQVSSGSDLQIGQGDEGVTFTRSELDALNNLNQANINDIRSAMLKLSKVCEKVLDKFKGSTNEKLSDNEESLLVAYENVAKSLEDIQGITTDTKHSSKTRAFDDGHIKFEKPGTNKQNKAHAHTAKAMLTWYLQEVQGRALDDELKGLEQDAIQQSLAPQQILSRLKGIMNCPS